jgi:hypothetical protein
MMDKSKVSLVGVDATLRRRGASLTSVDSRTYITSLIIESMH